MMATAKNKLSTDFQSAINCVPERSLLGAFGKQHHDYDHDVFNSAGSTLATPHFGPENGVHLKDPKLVFTSLYHHITDIDNLRASYDKLLAHKASGIDGVTKEEYGKQLEENLRDLSSRLKRMGYRPSPKRRTYVPKPGSEKGGPLGISNFEDKIVEEATKRTLEPIYDVIFQNHDPTFFINMPPGSKAYPIINTTTSSDL